MSDYTLWLKQLACFSFCSDEAIHDLANCFHEVRYRAGDILVKEGALIDSVYMIVEGMAEVSHATIKISKIIKKKKIKKTLIAVLHPGEAIGLNDTGFYSQTGKRTATVTAQTDMLLLALDLKQLHEFFKIHPLMQSTMEQATESILRMRLIKQSLPFSQLSYERLQLLASQVKRIDVKAGDVIFHQGDRGDCCYLIRSGLIEIVIEEQGDARQLATLRPPTLFGEATLITHSPRNATARALQDSELLMLKFDDLAELLESEDNVADMFMTLMVDRSRPIQNPSIRVHPRVGQDGQETVILKNPENNSYFKLSPEGWFIWQQLDGKQTMQDITLVLSEKYNTFAPDVVVGIISKLARAGFVYHVDVQDTLSLSKQPLWLRALFNLRKILEIRVAIGDADKWLTCAYQKLIRYLLTSPGKIFLSSVALVGVLAFVLKTPLVIDLFKTIHGTWYMFLLLIPCTIFSIALHELGHAFATKSFGYEVHYMGVGWYWLSPIAFTDTSDMWLSSRGPRIIVNMAGIFTDLLTAGVVSLVIFLVSNYYVICFLWLFALYTYINAFRMLNPLQDMDGYYILMDLFDKPKLRQSAVIWLIRDFPKALRTPRLFRKNKPEIVYWLACVAFLILVSGLTLGVQGFVFKILGWQMSNSLVTLLLPFVVVVLSCLGIIAELRHQTDK